MTADEKRKLRSFGFKRIGEYTNDELNAAIDWAVEECKGRDLAFFDILRGVDAYFEKRRRKQRSMDEPTRG